MIIIEIDLLLIIYWNRFSILKKSAKTRTIIQELHIIHIGNFIVNIILIKSCTYYYLYIGSSVLEHYKKLLLIYNTWSTLISALALSRWQRRRTVRRWVVSFQWVSLCRRFKCSNDSHLSNVFYQSLPKMHLHLTWRPIALCYSAERDRLFLNKKRELATFLAHTRSKKKRRHTRVHANSA